MLMSRSEYARQCGITSSRVTQLVARGLPTHGDLVDDDLADEWRNNNLDPAKQAADRHWRNGDGSVLKDRADERRRSLQLDNQLKELNLAERQGSLIAKQVVQNKITTFVKSLKNDFLSFIARTAPIISSECQADGRKVFSVLDREVRQFLTELSQSSYEKPQNLGVEVIRSVDIPPEAIAILKKHPELLAEDFDLKYGVGSSSRFL